MNDKKSKSPARHESGQKTQGRPPKMTDGKRVNIYLDQPSLDRAAELGGGNVSKGIRKALSD